MCIRHSIRNGRSERATIARYRQAETCAMHSPIALDRSNRAARAIGASLFASERAQCKEQAAASGSDVGGEGKPLRRQPIAFAARTAGNALGRRHNNVRRSGGSQAKAELHLVKHEGWILQPSYRDGGGIEAEASGELGARGARHELPSRIDFQRASHRRDGSARAHLRASRTTFCSFAPLEKKTCVSAAQPLQPWLTPRVFGSLLSSTF